jgi:multicomponent Na+:H+ antiporter subunit F
MFGTILNIVLIMLSINIVICFVRTLIGPSLPDRILALDAIGMQLIGIIGVIMIVQDTVAYAEVALVLSILAFLGTVALSKFIERGVIFDPD